MAGYTSTASAGKGATRCDVGVSSFGKKWPGCVGEVTASRDDRWAAGGTPSVLNRASSCTILRRKGAFAMPAFSSSSSV